MAVAAIFIRLEAKPLVLRWKLQHGPWLQLPYHWAKQVGLDLSQSIVSLDRVYESRSNRKAIFNRGMVPNIPENPRARKTSKPGRKPVFDPAIVQERFYAIERVFAWEDKFRRLVMRFGRISELRYALKSLAYTMINLRHFCKG